MIINNNKFPKEIHIYNYMQIQNYLFISDLQTSCSLPKSTKM